MEIKGTDLNTQNEKIVRKMMEMETVEVKTKNFVRLNEKLRCFSIDILGELQEQCTWRKTKMKIVTVNGSRKIMEWVVC